MVDARCHVALRCPLSCNAHNDSALIPALGRGSSEVQGAHSLQACCTLALCRFVHRHPPDVDMQHRVQTHQPMYGICHRQPSQVASSWEREATRGPCISLSTQTTSAHRSGRPGRLCRAVGPAQELGMLLLPSAGSAALSSMHKPCQRLSTAWADRTSNTLLLLHAGLAAAGRLFTS